MLVSKANTAFGTHAGLEVMAHRLVRELEAFVREQSQVYTPDEIHLTLVGHSLGGLIARYAAKLLLNGETQFYINDIPVLPHAYYSIGTPHLGARISQNCGDSGLRSAMGFRFLCYAGLGLSGRQLHLEVDTLMEMSLDSGTSFRTLAYEKACL
jgi:triacylglycerol esterase/lipase EstA (alpha/beta hydrolase family)